MSRHGRWLAVLSLLLISAAWGEAVYRWTDAQGRVHFGDTPPDQRRAQSVELRPNVTQSEPVPQDTFAGSARVVLYSAAWCGVCKKAKAYMQAKAIAYTEYDIETTRKGREDFRRLNGTGVPIILVGEQRMNGFDATRLQSMLGREGPNKNTP